MKNLERLELDLTGAQASNAMMLFRVHPLEVVRAIGPAKALCIARAPKASHKRLIDRTKSERLTKRQLEEEVRSAKTRPHKGEGFTPGERSSHSLAAAKGSASRTASRARARAEKDPITPWRSAMQDVLEAAMRDRLDIVKRVASAMLDGRYLKAVRPRASKKRISKKAA